MNREEGQYQEGGEVRRRAMSDALREQRSVTTVRGGVVRGGDVARPASALEEVHSRLLIIAERLGSIAGRLEHFGDRAYGPRPSADTNHKATDQPEGALDRVFMGLGFVDNRVEQLFELTDRIDGIA